MVFNSEKTEGSKISVNILHLTDLHFNRDVSPGGNQTQYSQQRNSLNGIIETIRTIEDEWKPSIIVISGDIGWAGRLEDYNEAKEWILDLVQQIGLPLDKVVMCAGNHDLDQNRIAGSPPSSAQEADNLLKIERIQNYVPLFENFIEFQKNINLPILNIGTAQNYLVGVRQIDDIRFIVLNSAWFSYGQIDRGNLWIGLPFLEVMNQNGQLMNQDNYNTENISIAVINHPKEWFNQAEIDYYSRPAIYSNIAKRCQIILSGHTHSRELDAPDTIRNRALLFTGGATYAEAYYQNTFSIFRIDKRNRKISRRIFYSNLSIPTWFERNEVKTYDLNSPPDIPNDQQRTDMENFVNQITPQQNLRKEEIYKLHILVNELNYLLDNVFTIIKRRYFPDIWRVGIFIDTDLSDETIGYSLYPIPWSINDVEIKIINQELKQELIRRNVILTWTLSDKNYFTNHPKKKALELVLKRVRGLLNTFYLDNRGSEFLATEFIFGFIDKLYKPMNIKVQDDYNLKDIEDALYKTFPSPNNHFIGFGVNEISVGVFEEFLIYLKNRDINQIKRIYKRQDRSRLRKYRGLVYNVFSREDLETNLERFYMNLAETYATIVDNNFPHLKNELALFSGATKLLVKPDLRESYTGHFDLPSQKIIALRNKEEVGLEIKVYSASERLPTISKDTWDIGLSIDGKNYELLYHSEGILDSSHFEDWPMLSFIYKKLKKRFEEHYRDKFGFSII